MHFKGRGNELKVKKDLKMTKKKGEYSVLSEVNTEDDWRKLLDKEVSLCNCFFKPEV